MHEQIQIVVVDDHARYRTSLAETLSAERDIVVVGQGASAAEAVALVGDLAPDIVLLDLDMPGGGLAAAAQIAGAQQAVKVVILTGAIEKAPIRAAQELGARGYILKGISARDLARSIRAIQGGTSCWPAADSLSLYPSNRTPERLGGHSH